MIWQGKMAGMEYTTQRHARANRLLIMLCAIWSAGWLAACDAPEKPQPPARENTDATATNTAENPTPFPGDAPAIGAEDIANLAAAMHGAAHQQPSDAPKDKYGKPYILGNLGGMPVNLPASVADLVEYEDSPGWDPQKLRDYRPPVRDYNSVITSFGFEFRNHDRLLYDRKDEAIYEAFENAIRSDDQQANDWAHVTISSGSHYGSREDALDAMLADLLDPEIATENRLVNNRLHERLPEDIFGLEAYANIGMDPETGYPMREDEYAEDTFVARNAQGKVQSFIRCSNRQVPYPPCRHWFKFPKPIKIRINVRYNRHQLKNWQSIEKNTIRLVMGFKAETVAGEQ